MRLFIVIFLVLIAGTGAGFYVWKRAEAAKPKPPPPKPALLVTAEGKGRAAQSEALVARPLEEALAKLPGVTHLRTRVSGKQVRIEVWAPPGTNFSLEGATVTRLDLPPETVWIVKGERRPEPMGEVCGRENPVTTVKLDPLRLPPLRLDALSVANALKAAPLEELRKQEIAPQVRVDDVAQLEVAPPPPTCLAFAPPDPVFAVTTREGEVSDATKLGPSTKIELYSPSVPKLEAVAPALVLRRLPSQVTLHFSPPLDAAGRAKVLAELQKQPGLSVRHVDGVRRVRLVFTGNDRQLLRGIAGTVADTLRHVKGVELVVTPLEDEPYYEVKVDREKASALGIPAVDVEGLVELARHGRMRHGLRVVVPISEPEHIGALILKDHRLAELITITAELEPVELLREDRQAAVEVVAYGIDEKAVPMPALPAGVQLEIHEEL